MSDHHNETPENCTHDCSTCGENCEHAAESLQQALRPGAVLTRSSRSSPARAASARAS